MEKTAHASTNSSLKHLIKFVDKFGHFNNNQIDKGDSLLAVRNSKVGRKTNAITEAPIERFMKVSQEAT